MRWIAVLGAAPFIRRLQRLPVPRPVRGPTMASTPWHQQGGAAPRPFPAPPSPGVLRRIAGSLPPTIRAGFGILAVGLLADAGYHAVPGLRPHTHTGGSDVAFAIHLIVLVGMLTTLAGVAAIAARSIRSSAQKEEIR